MPRKQPAGPAGLNFPQIILGIIGLAFLGFGLVFFFMLGQDSRLECTRGDGTHCSIVIRWLNLIPNSRREIVKPKTAWVDRSCDSQGCTYRVMITSAQGDMPLSDTYTSDGDQQYARIKQINDFIAGSGPSSLTIQTSDMAWIILPIVFMLLGGLLLLLALRGIPALLKAARGG